MAAIAVAVFYAELALAVSLGGAVVAGLSVGVLWVVDALLERIR